MDTLLDIYSTYYDIANPAGYSGVSALTRAMKGKMNQKQVQEWLQKQETYTLHKPLNRKFPRNRYILSNFNELWQVDLSDMRKFSQYNDGYNLFKYFFHNKM